MYLAQTPDLSEVAEIVSSLEFADSLIVIIIVLCFIILGLVGFLVIKDKNTSKLEELDSTNINMQQENFFELIKRFLEQSAEKDVLFKNAIDEFSISNKMQKEGLVEFKKHLEMKESADAQRAERLREIIEKETLKNRELIKEIMENIKTNG